MPPRLYLDQPLAAGIALSLPDGAARHVQVLRLQPGWALTLFDGRGGEWSAQVATIGRREVAVEVGAHDPVERELPFAVTLALGMPANDRMDFVVEKATELGAAAIQPLVCERSVLRLDGERAAKKVAHWQAVAVAAAEQSGRTRVPRIEPVQALGRWLESGAGASAGAAASSVRPPSGGDPRRWLLGFESASRLAEVARDGVATGVDVTSLSGPEGGLSPDEERAAQAAGWVTVSLGERVLRADTAPLALLAWLALQPPA